jgi:hypothetical protein
MVNNSINVQWTTKNNLEMECRNRKRQTRDEQLGKGKYSSQRQETERDKLGMNSWARAKTVAKDKKQKETN